MSQKICYCARGERDPGPMARFHELKRDPATLGLIVQRIGTGESLRAIARAWQIPYRPLCEWMQEQGRALRANCRPKLRVVEQSDGLI
jgi:hypothetical protein